VGKNVAVFVDVANIFYAAKAAGVDIDYVTMLKSATAGRDLVRAYAYTGLDPDNENQRNFHDFLRRSNYKVVSKDIRKYGDGKVKANLDIELVVDMMKTARNLDVAIVVSGDGDFAPAIRAVQEMGVRVEVISFRGNTSSDLIEVADLFTDIVQIARVEKGSSRSGRRVATDDEDLSMTEVPDKQTEGTGVGRGRGRGRGRPAEGERTPAVARTGRGRPRPVPVDAIVADAETAGGERPALVALPGEKLSRARVAAAAGSAVNGEDDEAVAAGVDQGPDADGAEGEEGRRRRRRGGRGRGRGRGREGEVSQVGEAAAAAPSRPRSVEAVEEELPAAPRAPRAAAFGSVWDSQIGVPATPGSLRSIPANEEFDDEPAIPEYLIAERRGNGRSANRGGARGGRSGYSAAVDRERYGRGGSGGINRYPDVSGRTANPAPRDDRPDRGPRDSGPRDGGRRDDRGYGRGNRPERSDRTGSAPRPGEQWSEVPPELEAMLRAQMATGGAPRRARGPERSERASSGPRQTAPSSAVADAAPADAAPAATSAPKRTATRAPRPATAAKAPAAASAAGTATGEAAEKPKRTTARTTRAKAPTAASAAGSTTADTAEKPKRTATRTTRAKAQASTAATEAATGETAEKPKRRTTRAQVAADA
jgi:uncharacterized LabA/DUF88 family protein